MTSLVTEYIATRDDRPYLIEKELKGDSNTKISLERPPTLFHSIERSALPPHEKSAIRLQQEGTTMLFAGSETTARLLAHTIFHLLDNPNIVQRIKDELLEAMGDDEQIPDLKVLEKLRWLVKSSLIIMNPGLALTACDRLPLSANPFDSGLQQHLDFLLYLKQHLFIKIGLFRQIHQSA